MIISTGSGTVNIAHKPEIPISSSIYQRVFWFSGRIISFSNFASGGVFVIKTILITDDNVLDNAILRNYLYNQRVNLITALNGREALELVESRNVDLIILDMVMPVLDGFEFLKIFSKTQLYKEIPIIVASSLDDARDIEKILNYKIYDYVIKPLDHINRLILVNKIKNALRYRQTLSELKKANRIINKMADKV